MRSLKWTFICTAAATAFVSTSAMAQVCGDPGAGDCCSANGTPACSDAECCNLICAQDAFCCDTQWDQICADAAASQCVVCSGGGGCELAVPTFIEPETCGSDLNGGCNSTPAAWDTVSVGDIVQGTFWADGNIRDTDWYRFSVAEQTEVTVTLRSAIPSFAAFVDVNGCTIIGQVTQGGNCPGETSFCFAPGEYYVVALTNGFAGFPCGGPSGNDYTLEIAGVPCVPGAGCAKAGEAFLGFNDFDTSNSTEFVDLAGFCDPGPFGNDGLYNVQYFRFTPTESGVYSVSTCALAGFDTRLAVMEGCLPADGVLACNDDGNGCPNFSSLIEAVELEAGVEYIILVGGYAAGDAGAGQFEIAPYVPCELATPTQSEVELCGEDLNGGCNSPVFANEPIALGQTVAGTFWADNDVRDTDWYLLDITEGTEVSLSIRSSLGCFAAIVGTDCGGIIGEITSGECPEVTSVCLAPGQYYVVALTDVFTGYPCGGPLGNDYTLEVTGVACDAAPPANDNCADATVAIEGANPFDNTFASTEVVDPSCGFGGAPFTKDVWFSFTATQDGDYLFETCSGSAPFDTGVEVWDNCPSNGGTIVACNDDGTGCPALASSVAYGMTTGQVVYVRVGGWQGATGATELIISFGGDLPGCGDPGTGDCCVANGTPFCEDAECCNLICAQDPFCCNVEWDQICADAAVNNCSSCSGGGGGGCDGCTNPTVVNVGDNAFTNSTTGCQVDLTGICDPGPLGTDIIYNTNFYSFTPANSGAYSFSTCNTATFDTKIAVMAACDPTAGVLGCNDDGTGCAGFTSFIDNVELTGGTTYIVAIGGYAAGTPAGSGTLTIAESSGPPEPPANDECVNAIAVNQGPTAFSNQLATGLLPVCVSIDNDVWFKYTATGDQPITISLCAAEGGSATFDTAMAVYDGSCTGSLVACNDDTCGLQSRVTFNATCGTTYYIAVGSYSPAQFGTGTFVVSQAGTCAPPCPADLNGDGQVGAADLAALLNAWGTPGADLNGDGTTNSQDLAALLNGFGPCQ